jgi:hypothetical protein
MSNAQSKTPQPPSFGQTLYGSLKAAGCQLDHYKDDLYVLVSPEATAILRAVLGDRMPRTLRDQFDGAHWYDVPYMYTPALP